MSTELHGTWRLIASLDRHGKEHPSSFHAEYSFNADGSASFNFPDGSRLPMQWKLVNGRLLIGARLKEKTRTSVGFEMPVPDRLILRGMHGSMDQGAVFERVPEKEMRLGWSVWIESGSEHVTYEDDERTCRFRIDLGAGGVVVHTYEWLDVNGKKQDVTRDVIDVVVRRTVDYLQKAGWRDKVQVIGAPPVA
jgi:hypothetical protein